ncbi:methyltransferase domain-containing protein [Candidatus Woesearchaeota archaeon]|nr:methyltransferase domain-containing protein [Candidatus Woesearchaeota archaeon]
MNFAWIKLHHPKLATAEIEGLIKEKCTRKNELVFTQANLKGLEKRLALTRATYELCFTCKQEELEKRMQNYNWETKYHTNFRITTHNCKIPEKKLGSIVWKKLKEPKVELKKPKTNITIFCNQGKAHVGIEKERIKERFEERRGKNRPCKHPTTMHPTIARAIINLTGAKERLTDPMCGAGGILIEAGKIGLKTYGYDIDKKVLEKARKNLKHFGIKTKLQQKDATTITKKLKYIATDLPYGHSTNPKNLEKTYKNFLKMLRKNLTGKAAIMYPHWTNIPQIAKKLGMTTGKTLSIYVHKGLTRNIVVISNPQ